MNNKNIKIVDEHGIDRNANVMFAFGLSGSEYVTYWIERDEDNANIFVSKIIKNIDGTFNMLDIDDSMEKAKLSDIVKTLITTAVNDEADKLSETFVTLVDGKRVDFIAVSFNKEQRINVQKTYITTVKKEVTRVTEKYYDVGVEVVQQNIFEDIFPTVTPLEEKVQEEVNTELPIPNIEENHMNEVVSVVEPVIPEPVLSAPVVEIADKAEINNNVLVAAEESMSNVDDVVQTIPVLEPVVMPNVENSSVIPTVVESITMAEPVINVEDKKEDVLLASQSESVVEPVVESPVIVEPIKVESQPLVFNASKETNLNAALGEVANSASIPVQNIEPIREFGVDEVSNNPINIEPVVSKSVQSPVDTGNNGGFANSKFFIVVAVVFFLASCIFLGYEVFNYFQLIK